MFNRKYWLLGLFLILASFALLFLIGSIPAHAASKCDNVIISEIMPNPAIPLLDSLDEWIELENTTGSDIDLGGCKLKDVKGSVHEFAIPSGRTISANGFAVFYSRDTKISLNNNEDGMIFLAPDGAIISQTPDYRNAPSGKSFAFNGSGWDWAEPTDGAVNITVSGPDSTGGGGCDGLIISELMPNPASPQTDASDEWIEIFNTTDSAINSGGCILTDVLKPGSTHDYVMPSGSIESGIFQVFYSRDTKISLNNDGDQVRLLNPDKSLIFETPNYGNAAAGQSFAYDGKNWSWTTVSTPGEINEITVPDQAGSGAKSGSKKAAKSKGASKAKRSSKSASAKLAKSGKSSSGASGDVLGDSTGGNTDNAKKINDKVLGYILIILACAAPIGYLAYTKKEWLLDMPISRKILKRVEKAKEFIIH